jgi:hypothetical protein
MRITFVLTSVELKTAQKVFSRRTHSLATRFQAWLNPAAPLAMAIILLMSGFRFFRHPYRTPDIFALVTVPVWLASAAIQWIRKRSVLVDPDYRKEQTLELEEDGLFRSTAEAARIRVPWTKISRYVETDEFFLLSSPWPWGIGQPAKPSALGTQGKAPLYILPKRAFADGDVEQVRDLLRRKLSVWAKNSDLKAATILRA